MDTPPHDDEEAYATCIIFRVARTTGNGTAAGSPFCAFAPSLCAIKPRIRAPSELKRPSRSRWPILFQFLCEMRVTTRYFSAYFFFLAVFFAAFFFVAMFVASFRTFSLWKFYLARIYLSRPITWRNSSLDTRYCGAMAEVVKRKLTSNAAFESKPVHIAGARRAMPNGTSSQKEAGTIFHPFRNEMRRFAPLL